MPRFPVKSIEDVERAAGGLREKWDLGSDPIEDLCGQLETCGVKVIAIDGPQGFDGFSCWVNDRIPVIAFNVNVPGDRQRFDLAHELGHLALDPDPTVNVEKTAHRFAAAFLVPASAASGELGRKRSNLSFDELLLLKQRYGVSIQAWMRRAFDLEIISQQTYSVLCRRLSARGWRTQEPDGVPTEKPRRLRLLVHQALAEKLITPSFAATLLNEPKTQSRLNVRELSQASSALVEEYANNPELTTFTEVDLEDFYGDDR